MPKLLLLILSALVYGIAFSQNKEIEELTRLNQQWIDSYPKGDTAALGKIFADDFVLINPGGVKMTRTECINNVARQNTISSHVDSVSVRLLTADVGIVTAYASFELKSDDKNVKGQTCYQDVYIKRKGKWLAVSAHVTLLK